MSTNNNMSLPGDPSAARAMATRDAEVLDRPEHNWTSVPALLQPATAPSTNVSTYLHALRRHWGLAAFMGLLVAAAAGVGTWFGYGASYESSAYLHVSALERPLVFRTADSERVDITSEFENFKNTQIGYITRSRFVLTAALRLPEVRELNIDQWHSDPVSWLADKLSVSFANKSELMEIRLVRPSPKETYTLVNAVVSAYLSEVVDADKNRRLQRLSDLDRIYADKEGVVRSKLAVLKNLAETLGTSDTKTVSLKQQIAMEQFGQFQRQLMQTQFDLQHAKGSLDAVKSRLARLVDLEISPEEIELYANSNLVAKEIAQELAMRKIVNGEIESTVVPGKKSGFAIRARDDTKRIEAQWADIRKEIEEMVRGVKRAKMEDDKLKFETEVAVLAQQVQELSKDVETKRDAAEKLSASSIDLEMTRTDVEGANKILQGIREERERLQVEIKSPPRIVLRQPAELPQSQYLISLRIALSVVASLVGFCLPVGLIVWWDTGAQRVNGPAEISKGIGINVLGSMPLLPARALRGLGGATRWHQNWQSRLSESVDSIAARLLRRASLEPAHVLLISSATRGEGKTTVATQLALSLARNGRRTVLVDFDLRRPALAAAFDVPLEPGLCDMLRGGNELGQLIHPTGIEESLFVVPAGSWDRLALAALANGGAAPIFAQLREQFEFVIVDASPILPVADTRFVSQHVDAVVLSVFRDKSQAPKVQAACEILDAFGVRTLEAVLVGSSGNLRDRDLG